MESETAEELKERFVRERKEAEIKGTIVRPLLMTEIQKLKSISKPTDDFFEHFIPGKLIGQGTICEGVYQCENKLTGEQYAVKILSRNLLKFWDRKRYQMEVEILMKLSHPNIIRFEHYFYTSTRYFIVTELANGLELSRALNLRNRKVDSAGKTRRMTPR